MHISFDDLGPKLSISKILSHVTEEEIYKRWCSDFPSHSFSSPFRKDKNPSFGFFVGKGKWLWKDAIGEHGDVFDFVMKAENTNLEGALTLIAKSFHIDTGFITPGVLRPGIFESRIIKKEPKERSSIWAERKPFNNQEIEWWGRVCINPEIIKFLKIRSASKIWLQKPDWAEPKVMWRSYPEDPIYYWLSPYSNHLKCYRPLHLDSSRKWLSNMDDNTDIMGYMQADIKRCPGRPLLMVKSMKEIGFFRAFGYTAMAQNAEGYIINKDFMRHIKKYCHPILSIYDNDIAGIKGMQRLKHEYGVPGLVIPKYGQIRTAKDPTDLWLKDKEKAYKLLNLINEYLQFLKSGVDEYSFGFYYT